jgi:hypothetical protein
VECIEKEAVDGFLIKIPNAGGLLKAMGHSGKGSGFAGAVRVFEGFGD